MTERRQHDASSEAGLLSFYEEAFDDVYRSPARLAWGNRSVVDGSIRDGPGHGAVVGGDVEGQGVSVIVTSNDGRTARLPTSPFYVRSNFAVPIPAGVDIPDIPLG